MSQLAGTMSFIATSLGVRCDTCHVTGDFASDAKAEKKTARQMIAMQLGIDKQSFEGRREVTDPGHQPFAQEDRPRRRVADVLGRLHAQHVVAQQVAPPPLAALAALEVRDQEEGDEALLQLRHDLLHIRRTLARVR